MDWLARLLTRRGAAWAVVAICLTLSGVGGLYATQVEHDDDLLAFLPEGNADVAAFKDINQRFGGLVERDIGSLDFIYNGLRNRFIGERFSQLN